MNEGSQQNSEDVDTEVSKRVVGVTTGGKQLVIKQTRQGPWRIAFNSGGELPSWLSGIYTKYEVALVDVNKYLAQDKEKNSKKTEEVATDAKGSTKSELQHVRGGKAVGRKPSKSNTSKRSQNAS